MVTSEENSSTARISEYSYRTVPRYTNSSGLLVSTGLSASCRHGGERQLGVLDEDSGSRHGSGNS